jgi:phosphoribosylanthranilate isomerase
VSGLLRHADGSDAAAFVLKVCGITRERDALHAVEHGATAIGFIFWPRSPRYIAPDAAGAIISRLPDHVVPVGVFVDEPIGSLRESVARSGVQVAQLHGAEAPDYAGALTMPLLKSITLLTGLPEPGAWPTGTAFLLDAFDPVRRGGTGATVDWTAAAGMARRVPMVLAGGLTAENVAEAIAAVRPAGVDVSSGVEESPGVKDLDKVRRFLDNARRAMAGTMLKAVTK